MTLNSYQPSKKALPKTKRAPAKRDLTPAKKHSAVTKQRSNSFRFKSKSEAKQERFAAKPVGQQTTKHSQQRPNASRYQDHHGSSKRVKQQPSTEGFKKDWKATKQTRPPRVNAGAEHEKSQPHQSPFKRAHHARRFAKNAPRKNDKCFAKTPRSEGHEQITEQHSFNRNRSSFKPFKKPRFHNRDTRTQDRGQPQVKREVLHNDANAVHNKHFKNADFKARRRYGYEPEIAISNFFIEEQTPQQPLFDPKRNNNLPKQPITPAQPIIDPDDEQDDLLDNEVIEDDSLSDYEEIIVDENADDDFDELSRREETANITDPHPSENNPSVVSANEQDFDDSFDEDAFLGHTSTKARAEQKIKPVIQRRKCVGCGAYLTAEVNTPGYIPAQVAAHAKLCMRCFKMRHYGQISVAPTVTEAYAQQTIRTFDPTRCAVFYIASPVNLPFVLSTINDIRKQTPFFRLVLTQTDVYFVATKTVLQTIDQYISKIAPELKSETIIVSPRTNRGYSGLEQALLQANADGHKIAFTGETNVGKSTLINWILRREKSKLTPLTVNWAANTTQGVRALKLKSFTLIDTPGMLPSGNYDALLDANTTKSLHQNYVSAAIRLFQIRRPTTYLIGNHITVSVTPKPDVDAATFAVYGPSTLTVTRRSASKVNTHHDMNYALDFDHNSAVIVLRGLVMMRIKAIKQLTIAVNKQCDAPVVLNDFGF